MTTNVTRNVEWCHALRTGFGCFGMLRYAAPIRFGERCEPDHQIHKQNNEGGFSLSPKKMLNRGERGGERIWRKKRCCRLVS